MNDQIGFGFLQTKYDGPPRDRFAAPAAPFQSTSDTSVKAAEEIEPHRLTQERRVFLAYKRRGRYGATQAEIEKELDLCSGSVCARTNALTKKNLVIKTDCERMTPRGGMASVYIAKEFAP